ncbi:hypothetical protein NDU88_001765, partial [Pleurodeles waltl]
RGAQTVIRANGFLEIFEWQKRLAVRRQGVSSVGSPPAPSKEKAIGWQRSSVGTLCQLETFGWLPVPAGAAMKGLWSWYTANARDHLENHCTDVFKKDEDLRS